MVLYTPSRVPVVVQPAAGIQVELRMRNSNRPLFFFSPPVNGSPQYRLQKERLGTLLEGGTSVKFGHNRFSARGNKSDQ